MKRTSILAAVAAGVITLATGAHAFAAEMNLTPGSVVSKSGSDVTVMHGASDTLRLHFAGAEIVTHEPDGGLMIVKARGQLMHYRPEAYQLIDGEMKPVEVHFRIEGKDRATVQFGKVDNNAPVILKGGAVMSSQPVWR